MGTGVNEILEILEKDPTARIDELLLQYQLRPTLLDGIIPRCIQILTSHFVRTNEDAALLNIYTFTRVRGDKHIVATFPTDIRCIHVVLEKLGGTDQLQWQCEHILLLWLAALVLIPFDLNAISDQLFSEVSVLAEKNLRKTGKQRDSAALVLARLLTRENPHSTEEIDRFVSSFRLSQGKLQILANAMSRVVVVPRSVYRLIYDAQQKIDDDQPLIYYESIADTRLWLKILGRAALIDLSLAEFAVAECISLLENRSSQVRMSAAKYIARLSHKLGIEPTEEICEYIAESLEDADIQLASPDHWNGSLIALAEILRQARGSQFMVELVSRIVENILKTKGLHFVQSGIKTTLGSSVRDAACYTAWSIFRSPVGVTKESRMKLYSSLITLAMLDEEVNIRRAAAAALQEGLGRYGSSAGDMDAEEMFRIINNISFTTVSSLPHCYESILPSFIDYCESPAYFIVLHGINNVSPETRRHIARAVPKLTSNVLIPLIETLLAECQHLEVSENVNLLHGAISALGYIYSQTELSVGKEAAKSILHKQAESDSDLVREALLRLVAILPDDAAELLDSTITEQSDVLQAAQDLMLLLPHETVINEIVPLCGRKLSDHHLFVACAVTIFKHRKDAADKIFPCILQASEVRNPQSRALATTCLLTNSDDSAQRLLARLNDYSEDERGDVGSWSREAAMLRLVDVGLPRDPDLYQQFVSALWLMASDSRQRTREISGQTLYQLNLIDAELPQKDTAAYYKQLLLNCPTAMRAIVAQGIASSVGATQASAKTINGSFRGLLEFLESEEHFWIIESIVKLDRSTTNRVSQVVKTLKRIVISGIEVPPRFKNPILAIAYNTTLLRRLPEVIMQDALDILQVYAYHSEPRAVNRFKQLLARSSSGNIRQRCADALYEVGIEDQVLETTDWTTREAGICAGNIKYE